MNPHGKFKVSRGGFDPWQSLAYTEEYIRQQKPFKTYYSKIRDLLTAPNHIILGHSVSADIGYLNLAINKSHCPNIKFCAYDTQTIYRRSVSKPQSLKLENIASDLGISLNGIELHKSCDDAKLSMLIVKALCQKLNCSIDKLIAKVPECLVKVTGERKKVNSKNKWHTK